MIIAAAAMGRDFEAIIPEKYEESSHLIIVETDTMEIVRCVENSDGEGMCYVAPMAELWCEAIVCGKIPQTVFPHIADEGISRYNGAGLSVRDALRGAEDNSLPLMVKE